MVFANILFIFVYLYLCFRVPARGAYPLLVVCSVLFVYLSHVAITVGVIELRFYLATSEAARDAVAGGDGAKVMVSVLFFGPMLAAITGAIGSTVLLFRMRMQSVLMMRERTHIKAISQHSSSNPYAPPNSGTGE